MKDDNSIEKRLENIGMGNTPEKIDKLTAQTLQQFKNNLIHPQSHKDW